MKGISSQLSEMDIIIYFLLLLRNSVSELFCSG